MAEGQSEHESWPKGSRLGGLLKKLPYQIQFKARKAKEKEKKENRDLELQRGDGR